MRTCSAAMTPAASGLTGSATANTASSLQRSSSRQTLNTPPPDGHLPPAAVSSRTFQNSAAGHYSSAVEMAAGNITDLHLNHPPAVTGDKGAGVAAPLGGPRPLDGLPADFHPLLVHEAAAADQRLHSSLAAGAVAGCQLLVSAADEGCRQVHCTANPPAAGNGSSG